MVATAHGDVASDSKGHAVRPRVVMRAFHGRRDRTGWLIGLLALLLGGVFVAVDLAYNGGTFIAPIDDAYIHLQYASQLGAGHPFQYNTGDPISSGASSLLYVFVLAVGYVVGFHGTALLVFAVVLGVVCMAVTAGLVYLLGRTLVGRAVGAWSGVLVAVSGPLLWGATSGMEIGLTALLVVATVLSFSWEQPRFRLTPVLAFLLAIVRPEGVILAVALCAAMLWTLARSGGFRRARGLAMAGWSLLPLAAIVGQYLFYWLATGTLRANGVASKSNLFDQPLFYAGQFLDHSVNNLRGAAGLFSGFTNQDFAFPAALLFALGGGAYLLFTRSKWRPLLTAVGAGYAVIAVSISTLSSALVHELRYWQPFMPIFILLAVCGLYGLTRVIPGPAGRRAGLHTLLVIALAFSVAALPTWALRLGRQSATIRDTDVSVGAWIDRNLPPDAIVAVKDVGAAKYFGHRKVIDTIGLATNGFAEASNNGIGSLYEKLRHLPAGERPDYFAVYPEPPGPSTTSLRKTGVMADPLITFQVHEPADQTGFRIVPFSEVGIYPANWDLAGSGDRSPVAGQVRDYLNVGYLASEHAHHYQPRMALPGVQPNTVLHGSGSVIDSGRTITGGELFTVHGLQPGKPLRIVARIKATDEDHHVNLRINGRQVDKFTLAPTKDRWQIRTFVVPASAVTSPTVRVELGDERPLLSPYPTYTSFGYWFIQ